jgi:Membrane-bound serine protease (ClpP class)
MRVLRLAVLCLLILSPLILQGEGGGFAILLEVAGTIGPATSDYISRGLRQAEARGATLIILRMDTPGGLDSAMREIVQDMLASPVPVVVFVAPSGARATSAGTYILYAANIAVMAPGTNLGAATPVAIGALPSPGQPQEDDKHKNDKQQIDESGDAMHRKVVNDAVAYIRALAEMRGRNVEWAEQAVRGAASLSAQEALKKGVIDLIARDEGELLTNIHGRKVQVLGQEKTFQTRDLLIERMEPDWRTRLLAVITDPNVAYILMLIGIYGLIFELASPGYILPGVVGAISLLLALYAFQVLPVNYAGLALMFLGIGFMIAEAFAPSFGTLGLGGVMAFTIGSIILLDTEREGYAISLPLIAAVALVNVAFFIGVVGMALKARKRPVVSGREQIIGGYGEVVQDFDILGRVRIRGEVWNARSSVAMRRGQRVRVRGMEGLTLLVEPAQEDH